MQNEIDKFQNQYFFSCVGDCLCSTSNGTTTIRNEDPRLYNYLWWRWLVLHTVHTRESVHLTINST